MDTPVNITQPEIVKNEPITSEILPSIEKELPIIQPEIIAQEEPTQPVTEPTTPQEQITSLNVVNTRTEDTLEHNITTTDKLSELADKDESDFIENVDTAHDKSKVTP